MDIKELVLSHKIFMTEKQRYSLLKFGTRVEVNGKLLTVYKKGNNTNEPCEDVPQKYYISNNFNEPILTGKYDVNLPNYDSIVGLLNPKNGGHKSFRFTYREISLDNITVHYIVIADFDDMKNSMLDIC